MLRFRTGVLALAVAFFGAGCAGGLSINQGEAADLELLQDGRRVPVREDGEVLLLTPKPFDIRGKAGAFHVCLSRDPRGIPRPLGKVDTREDVNSCLYSAKVFASRPEADYLVVSAEGSNRLDAGHGLRQQDDGRYVYTVRGLYDPRVQALHPLEQVADVFYALFWVDKNGNQKLEFGESAYVTLKFQ